MKHCICGMVRSLRTRNKNKNSPCSSKSGLISFSHVALSPLMWYENIPDQRVRNHHEWTHSSYAVCSVIILKDFLVLKWKVFSNIYTYWAKSNFKTHQQELKQARDQFWLLCDACSSNNYHSYAIRLNVNLLNTQIQLCFPLYHTAFSLLSVSSAQVRNPLIWIIWSDLIRVANTERPHGKV